MGRDGCDLRSAGEGVRVDPARMQVDFRQLVTKRCTNAR